MNVRRVIRIGNSLGISLPSKEIAALGIEEGTPIEVEIDPSQGRVILHPLHRRGQVDPEFAERASRFAERYRTVLEELAKR